MRNEISSRVAMLAPVHTLPHMPARKSADGAVANLVRSGRKQPQRFRAGSSASTPQPESLKKQATPGRPNFGMPDWRYLAFAQSSA